MNILALTMNKGQGHALRYLRAGIKGCINKSCSNEYILNAIRLVLSGKFSISNILMQLWADHQIHKCGMV